MLGLGPEAALLPDWSVDENQVTLVIATVLDVHRTRPNQGHFNEDEWHCCARALVPVVQAFVDAARRRAAADELTRLGEEPSRG